LPWYINYILSINLKSGCKITIFLNPEKGNWKSTSGNIKAGRNPALIKLIILYQMYFWVPVQLPEPEEVQRKA